MTHEPVAYINIEERKLEWAVPVVWHTPTAAQMDKVPLYAHQYSDLTDEEIIACIDESEPDTTDMIRFARAILERAQAK